MGTVLTNATTLVCPNKGTVQASSAAKLAVQQAAVLTAVAGDVVSNCGANPPCATVGAPTAGQASKLRAGGSPVLLDSIVVTSNTSAPITPDPTKLQTKLTAS